MATILPIPRYLTNDFSSTLNDHQDETMSFISYWSTLDPRLAMLDVEPNMPEYYLETDQLHLRSLHAIDPGHNFMEDSIDSAFFKSEPEPQLRLEFDHTVYQLPRYTASQASSESAPSECTLSPSIGRHPFFLPSAPVCDSPIAPIAAFDSGWLPPPVAPRQSPYANPRELVSPQSSCTPQSDLDTVHSKVQTPQELNIRHASPSDSGVGESIVDEESIAQDAGDDDDDTDYRPGARKSGPAWQTRRRNTKQKVSVQDPYVRVQKATPRKRASGAGKGPAGSRRLAESEAGKSFPCTFYHFGCTSMFGNKNEWKRHVASKHMQLWSFRCDLDGCADHERGPNEFNRKDLFTQHCRRMHAPWQKGKKHEPTKAEYEKYDLELANIRTRCWIERRQPPERSWCGFCSRVFENDTHGEGQAWEARMEHIGRHYEKEEVNAEDEEVDQDLRDWAVEEGIVEQYDEDEYLLAGFAARNSSARRRRNRRSSSVRARDHLVRHDEEDAPGEEE